MEEKPQPAAAGPEPRLGAEGPPRRPRRVDRVHERVTDDEIVLFDPRTEGVHALNRTAAAIWDLCDGDRDVESIARAIEAVLAEPAPRDAVLADVRRTVAELHRLGLIEEGAAENGPP